MSPPENCPTCGQPWPHDDDEHDPVADFLGFLYGPHFTVPDDGPETGASTP